MDKKILNKYAPMTETAFYILFSLIKEDHGYNLGLRVEEMTCGEVVIGPGTMYGTLGKLTKDGLIKLVSEEGGRKTYGLTDLGKEVLDKEIRRIERLYRNIKGE